MNTSIEVNGKQIPIAQMMSEYLNRLKQDGQHDRIGHLKSTLDALNAVRDNKIAIMMISDRGAVAAQVPFGVILDQFMIYFAEMIEVQHGKV